MVSWGCVKDALCPAGACPVPAALPAMAAVSWCPRKQQVLKNLLLPTVCHLKCFPVAQNSAILLLAPRVHTRGAAASHFLVEKFTLAPL